MYDSADEFREEESSEEITLFQYTHALMDQFNEDRFLYDYPYHHQQLALIIQAIVADIMLARGRVESSSIAEIKSDEQLKRALTLLLDNFQEVDNLTAEVANLNNSYLNFQYRWGFNKLLGNINLLKVDGFIDRVCNLLNRRTSDIAVYINTLANDTDKSIKLIKSLQFIHAFRVLLTFSGDNEYFKALLGESFTTERLLENRLDSLFAGALVKQLAVVDGILTSWRQIFVNKDELIVLLNQVDSEVVDFDSHFREPIYRFSSFFRGHFRDSEEFFQANLNILGSDRYNFYRRESDSYLSAGEYLEIFNDLMRLVNCLQESRVLTRLSGQFEIESEEGEEGTSEPLTQADVDTYFSDYRRFQEKMLQLMPLFSRLAEITYSQLSEAVRLFNHNNEKLDDLVWLMNLAENLERNSLADNFHFLQQAMAHNVSQVRSQTSLPVLPDLSRTLPLSFYREFGQLTRPIWFGTRLQLIVGILLHSAMVLDQYDAFPRMVPYSIFMIGLVYALSVPSSAINEALNRLKARLQYMDHKIINSASHSDYDLDDDEIRYHYSYMQKAAWILLNVLFSANRSYEWLLNRAYTIGLNFNGLAIFIAVIAVLGGFVDINNWQTGVFFAGTSLGAVIFDLARIDFDEQPMQNIRFNIRRDTPDIIKHYLSQFAALLTSVFSGAITSMRVFKEAVKDILSHIPALIAVPSKYLYKFMKGLAIVSGLLLQAIGRDGIITFGLTSAGYGLYNLFDITNNMINHSHASLETKQTIMAFVFAASALIGSLASIFMLTNTRGHFVRKISAFLNYMLNTTGLVKPQIRRLKAYLPEAVILKIYQTVLQPRDASHSTDVALVESRAASQERTLMKFAKEWVIDGSNFLGGLGTLVFALLAGIQVTVNDNDPANHNTSHNSSATDHYHSDESFFNWSFYTGVGLMLAAFAVNIACWLVSRVFSRSSVPEGSASLLRSRGAFNRRDYGLFDSDVSMSMDSGIPIPGTNIDYSQ